MTPFLSCLPASNPFSFFLFSSFFFSIILSDTVFAASFERLVGRLHWGRAGPGVAFSFFPLLSIYVSTHASMHACDPVEDARMHPSTHAMRCHASGERRNGTRGPREAGVPVATATPHRMGLYFSGLVVI